MTRTLSLEALAKVNRSLFVLGKRPDGFHELDTIFQTIDLSDRLTFEEASELELHLDDPSLPSGDDNLVMRAARALVRCGGRASGARITLEKRIPHGAGLGGGSSDAAATLRGLVALWRMPIAEEALHTLASELGSDVPFFLMGGRVRGRGRGERLQPLPDGPAEGLVLLSPPFSLSTGEVYRRVKARALSLTPESQASNLPASDTEVLPDRNDLEPAAEEIRGEVRRLRQALQEAGALKARLSGSGSTVFGIFGDLSMAQAAAERLAGLPAGMVMAGTAIRVVSTVSRQEFSRRSVPASVD